MLDENTFGTEASRTGISSSFNSALQGFTSTLQLLCEDLTPAAQHSCSDENGLAQPEREECWRFFPLASREKIKLKDEGGCIEETYKPARCCQNRWRDIREWRRGSAGGAAERM